MEEPAKELSDTEEDHTPRITEEIEEKRNGAIVKDENTEFSPNTLQKSERKDGLQKDRRNIVSERAKKDSPKNGKDETKKEAGVRLANSKGIKEQGANPLSSPGNKNAILTPEKKSARKESPPSSAKKALLPPLPKCNNNNTHPHVNNN